MTFSLDNLASQSCLLAKFPLAIVILPCGLSDHVISLQSVLVEGSSVEVRGDGGLRNDAKLPLSSGSVTQWMMATITDQALRLLAKRV